MVPPKSRKGKSYSYDGGASYSYDGGQDYSYDQEKDAEPAFAKDRGAGAEVDEEDDDDEDDDADDDENEEERTPSAVARSSVRAATDEVIAPLLWLVGRCAMAYSNRMRPCRMLRSL